MALSSSFRYAVDRLNVCASLMQNKVSTLIENSRMLENIAADTKKNLELQLKMRNDWDTGSLAIHIYSFIALNIAASFAKTRAGVRGEGTLERSR